MSKLLVRCFAFPSFPAAARSGLCLGILGLLLFAVGIPAVRSAEEEPKTQPARAEKPAKGYTLQDLDDPALPLKPKQPRTAQEQNRLDAMSWYMTGQLHEKRNEFNEALDDYKKAVALDPDSVQIYRALVPLAFSLNRTDEAVKYALKAVELDPEDYQLLRRLGVHMAQQREVPKAIELLEKAAESPGLKKNKAVSVMLQRDLAILYAAIGEKIKAADAFETVFEALQNPEKFGLNFRQQKSLEANPATTYEQIGQIFLDAERPQLAVKAFEAAAKARQGKPGALSFNLAQVYLQTKQYDKALDEIQKYLDAQLQTKGRAAYELLAKILKAKNQTGELIKRLEKMAENDPRNSTLQYFLAEQYLENNDLKEAETLYKKTLDGTNDPEGYAGLASVYRRQNKPEELLDALTQAVEAGHQAEFLADELKAISSDEKLLAQVIEVAKKANTPKNRKLNFAGALVVAKLAAEAKKTDDALEFYQVALEQRRDKAEVIYEEIGQMLFDADDYVKAAEWYRKAVGDAAVGQKAQFLFRLSQAEELAGNTQAALQAIHQAQAQLPQVALLQYQEGWIYFHAEKYDDALKKFEEVASKFPEDKETVRRSQFIISSIYVQRGELRKGEEVLEKVLAEDPTDPSVNNDLGYLYADHGKHLEKARSMIAIALKAEPENAAYLDSMGWVLYKLGEFKEAAGYLEKAVAKPTGGDATIWDHLGDCYARLKQRDKAKDAWQKALKDAKADSKPDEKLIKRIEQKLAGGEPPESGESP